MTAMSPSCQGAYGLRANVLNYCGRPEEAAPLARQSIRLSPVAQTFFPEVLATAHYLCGQLEEAIAAADKALALAPDSVDARVVLSASLVESGRVEAAQQAALEILSIDPRLTLVRFAASRPYRDDPDAQEPDPETLGDGLQPNRTSNRPATRRTPRRTSPGRPASRRGW